MPFNTHPETINKATQFPLNRQDHTKKGPYLLPLIKKFLNKKIDFEDPESRKMIRGQVKDAVIWRLILNATQGENQAIKEILDRIDGKVSDVFIDQSQHVHKTVIWELNGNKIQAPRKSGRNLGESEPLPSGGSRA